MLPPESSKKRVSIKLLNDDLKLSMHGVCIPLQKMTICLLCFYWNILLKKIAHGCHYCKIFVKKG